MDDITKAKLEKLYLTIRYLQSDDMVDAGQDASLTAQMAETMLGDILYGDMEPLAGYIEHYSDVLDHPAEDAARIAAEIEAQVLTGWA